MAAMTDKAAIPPSPSEADFVRQVTEAEPPALLTGDDPMAIFADWLAEAVKRPSDANAMSLATVDAEGLPDVRMVLLKDADGRGFVFYTNLGSAKGRGLPASPRPPCCSHWKSLRRQVRVRGSVSAVSDAEADAYWATRARASQIGAGRPTSRGPCPTAWRWKSASPSSA